LLDATPGACTASLSVDGVAEGCAAAIPLESRGAPIGPSAAGAAATAAGAGRAFSDGSLPARSAAFSASALFSWDSAAARRDSSVLFSCSSIAICPSSVERCSCFRRRLLRADSRLLSMRRCLRTSTLPSASSSSSVFPAELSPLLTVCRGGGGGGAPPLIRFAAAMLCEGGGGGGGGDGVPATVGAALTGSAVFAALTANCAMAAAAAAGCC